MTTGKHFNYLSLFSGIGGFELGLQKAVKKNSKIKSTSNASGTAKSTHTPPASTQPISNTMPLEISKISPHHNCQNLISFVEAFLVKHFHSLERDKGLKISEAQCSLKLLGLLRKRNHAFYCLKTLKGFYLTTKGKQCLPSSESLMNWGITVNGKCLTARILEYHNTANVCSLLDILEEHADQKYFLTRERYSRVFKT